MQRASSQVSHAIFVTTTDYNGPARGRAGCGHSHKMTLWGREQLLMLLAKHWHQLRREAPIRTVLELRQAQGHVQPRQAQPGQIPAPGQAQAAQMPRQGQVQPGSQWQPSDETYPPPTPPQQQPLVQQTLLFSPTRTPPRRPLQQQTLAAGNVAGDAIGDAAGNTAGSGEQWGGEQWTGGQKRMPWTGEEETALREAVAKHGERWSAITDDPRSTPRMPP